MRCMYVPLTVTRRQCSGYVQEAVFRLVLLVLVDLAAQMSSLALLGLAHHS